MFPKLVVRDHVVPEFVVPELVVPELVFPELVVPELVRSALGALSSLSAFDALLGAQALDPRFA